MTKRFQFLVFARATAFFISSGISSAQTFPVADSPLKAVLSDAATQVMSDCGAWPPKLINSTKPKDRAKDAKDITDNGRAEAFLQKFGDDLQLTKQEIDSRPHIYRGSLLRLLDSAGVFDPTIPNSKLLGIATLLDPSQLNLWGTDRFTVKHNCSSLLSLAGQGQVGYSIPLFALDAAFNAGMKGRSEKVVVLTVGSFESPFAKFWSPQAEPSQQIFASFRAINRRLTKSADESDVYIAAAKFLSLNKDLAITEQNSVIGDVKANIKFPFLSASGSVSAQMLNSFQQSSASYLTFYWNEKPVNLPTYSQAVDSINTRMPVFTVNTETVAVGSTVEASADVSGWPAEFCDQSWILNSSASYSPTKLTLDAIPAVSGGLPGCRIKAVFGLKTTPVDSSSVAEPALTMVRTDGSGTVVAQLPAIHMRLKSALHPAGKPSPVLDSNSPRWDSWPSAANKQGLKWTISGRIDLRDSNRAVSSKKINRENRESMKCLTQDGKAVNLGDLRFDGANPYEDTSAGSNFTVLAILPTNAGKAYQDDYSVFARSADRVSCSLSFTMSIKTTNSGGGADQEDTVTVQPSSPIDIPSELPAVPPAPENLRITAGDQLFRYRGIQRRGPRRTKSIEFRMAMEIQKRWWQEIMC